MLHSQHLLLPPTVFLLVPWQLTHVIRAGLAIQHCLQRLLRSDAYRTQGLEGQLSHEPTVCQALARFLRNERVQIESLALSLTPQVGHGLLGL